MCSVRFILKCVAIFNKVKAIEQFLHKALFIMPFKIVLGLNSVVETLVCVHSNERFFVSITFLFFCSYEL